MTPQRNEEKECEHEPTGRWSVRNGKSYADCIKCGEYETTLMEENTFPNQEPQ